jgi:hypothetical protein
LSRRVWILMEQLEKWWRLMMMSWHKVCGCCCCFFERNFYLIVVGNRCDINNIIIIIIAIIIIYDWLYFRIHANHIKNMQIRYENAGKVLQQHRKQATIARHTFLYTYRITTCSSSYAFFFRLGCLLACFKNIRIQILDRDEWRLVFKYLTCEWLETCSRFILLQ